AEETGTVPVASITAAKLRWLAENEPANAARTAAVCLPHDWLSWRLAGYGPGSGRAGLEALRTDRSDASGTGYWSPRTGEYLPAVL
ncbi:FGGY family carbohydrate kinase, partial [Leifsonia sp. SIMBA_070]|uniref:FGGY family carbohydrate kinase n=1 Tax=Leifsonia sp. SIMBA_070 TaxID=3085810 RepID=UPI00397A8F6A